MAVTQLASENALVSSNLSTPTTSSVSRTPGTEGTTFRGWGVSTPGDKHQDSFLVFCEKASGGDWYILVVYWYTHYGSGRTVVCSVGETGYLATLSRWRLRVRAPYGVPRKGLVTPW